MHAAGVTFEAFESLVAAARRESAEAELVVLPGGEAGLRAGEIMALEWDDIDLAKRQLTIRRSDWQGHVTAPKSGKIRFVPMTSRLGEARRQHRHLRGRRVLIDRDGQPFTHGVTEGMVKR